MSTDDLLFIWNEWGPGGILVVLAPLLTMLLLYGFTQLRREWGAGGEGEREVLEAPTIFRAPNGSHVIVSPLTRLGQVGLSGSTILRTPLPPGLRLSARRDPDHRSTTPPLTGDASFDERFEVHTNAPEATLQLLTAEVRRLLLALGEEVDHLNLKDNALTWTWTGYSADAEQVKALGDATVAAVQALHVAALEASTEQAAAAVHSAAP